MSSHFAIILNIQNHQNTSTYSHSTMYETKEENINYEFLQKINRIHVKKINYLR